MRKLLLVLCCFIFFVPLLATAANPSKTWTFLIFVNGNNSLDKYGELNIIDMEKVGSNDQVNIVVQWASYATHQVKRLLIQKSNDSSHVTSPVLEDLGAVDMGDYHSLDDFINWGVTNFPAEHYFIDVWNHGSGWHLAKAKGKLKAKGPEDISWDDFTGNSITTEQLGLVMKNAAKIIGHKVDIYGSDACLMAMAEVSAQMSASVRYFVGSQDYEPGPGWPYTDLMQRWEAIPSATPEDVAKIIVDAYVKSYQGGSNGEADVTFSAYDLEKFPALYKAISKLGYQIRQLNPKLQAKVIDAADSSQVFTEDYVDLVDFARQLKNANIHSLDPALAKVQAASADFVIANEDTDYFKNASGLSFWLPQDKNSYDQYAKRYQGLVFNHKTQWGKTLVALMKGRIASH